MKILIVIGGFWPAQNCGGPVISIDNLCTLFASEHEFYILTVDHDLNNKERFKNIRDGWNHRNNCQVLYMRETEVQYLTLKKIVRSLSPDMIYLNSLFLAKFTVPFLLISKIEKIPLLLAPRGELYKGFSSKTKKLIYINSLRPLLKSKNIYFQATSEEEKRQIEKYIGPKTQNILNLTNIPGGNNLKRDHIAKKKGELKCVFLARIQRKKNLLGALEILNKCSAKIIFDIYGPKETITYWKECQAIIDQLPANITVNYCGVVKHENVQATLAKYDLFFMPTYGENYGHSIIESLQAGTPVLISNRTPWIDLDSYKAGWSIDIENEQKFCECIEFCAAIGEKEYDTMSIAASRYALKKLKVNHIKKAYSKAFYKITN